ncbi:MAG: hypothetical protein AAFO95_13385, partial [Cyanobacteria bacterium J06600_6]
YEVEHYIEIKALLDLGMILQFPLLRKSTKKLRAESYEQITLRFHVVPLWDTLNQQRRNKKPRMVTGEDN